MPIATGARCATHLDVAAVEICQRCGAFVCGQCVELQGAEVFCPTCFTRQGGRGKASRRAVASLILGIVGLQCGLLPGVVGLILAYQELGAISRGESSAAGKTLAQAGKVLGWINAVILGAVVVAMLVGLVAAVAGRQWWN